MNSMGDQGDAIVTGESETYHRTLRASYAPPNASMLVASTATLAHSGPMSGSPARKLPLLGRRHFLLGMAWLAPGLSALAFPKALFAKGEKAAANMRIKHHCPGGEAEVVPKEPIPGSWGQLEVRRASDSPATVDQKPLYNGRCTLTLDLPTEHWCPGMYSARTKLFGPSGELLWESDWAPAFTLRPYPWEG